MCAIVRRIVRLFISTSDTTLAPTVADTPSYFAPVRRAEPNATSPEMPLWHLVVHMRSSAAVARGSGDCQSRIRNMTATRTRKIRKALRPPPREQYADAYRVDAEDIELAHLALEEKATMSEFQKYCRKQIAELRPYVVGEELRGISISDADLVAGSPTAGDMIARNPKNQADQRLVAAQYFADNFEPV